MIYEPEIDQCHSYLPAPGQCLSVPIGALSIARAHCVTHKSFCNVSPGEKRTCKCEMAKNKTTDLTKGCIVCLLQINVNVNMITWIQSITSCTMQYSELRRTSVFVPILFRLCAWELADANAHAMSIARSTAAPIYPWPLAVLTSFFASSFFWENLRDMRKMNRSEAKEELPAMGKR